MQDKGSGQAQPSLAVGEYPSQEGAAGGRISWIHHQIHNSSSGLAIASDKAPVQPERPFKWFLR